MLVAALESGTIDLAYGILPKDAKKYRNSDKYSLYESMVQGVTPLALNVQNEILQDINVRKALNMAINKEALIQADLQGEGVPANGPLPPTIFGYDPAVEQYGYKYSVEEAKKLLEASGWKENAQGIREKGGKRLSLQMAAPQATPGNVLIQSMLKEIGVDLKIQVLEAATMIEQTAKGKFDIIQDMWVNE
jgi:peptide/nickel transport system substrate-binding protein